MREPEQRPDPAPAPRAPDDADEQVVRRAISARGDRATMAAVVHGVAAVICAYLVVAGGEPLPFTLGALGLGGTGIWLYVLARRRRDGRSAPLHALLREPARVEALTVVDEGSGLCVRVTAAGATDYVCPPGSLDELRAVLARRCPAATWIDLR